MERDIEQPLVVAAARELREDATGAHALGRELSVLLVDDDAMVRGWVRLTLAESEFRLAGEAERGEQARELVVRRRPDLLLVDYRLPDCVGTELVRDLRLAGVTTPAVLMTANNLHGFNDIARETGAQGSVLKTGNRDELLGTLRAVAAGKPAFDSRHPRRGPGQGALSPREREVLRLVAAGATNRVVAAELGVSDETVKTLLTRAYAKLDAHKRAEAVARAHELGVL